MQKKYFPSERVKVYAPNSLEKKWFVYYVENGKRKRVYGNVNTFNTLELRREKILLLKRKIEASITQPMPADSVAKIFLEYIEKNKHTWRKSTLTAHEAKVKTLLAGTRGIISQTTLADFFSSFSKRYHPTTYAAMRAFVAGILTKANAAFLLDNVPKIKERKTPLRYFQSKRSGS